MGVLLKVAQTDKGPVTVLPDWADDCSELGHVRSRLKKDPDCHISERKIGRGRRLIVVKNGSRTGTYLWWNGDDPKTWPPPEIVESFFDMEAAN